VFKVLLGSVWAHQISNESRKVSGYDTKFVLDFTLNVFKLCLWIDFFLNLFGFRQILNSLLQIEQQCSPTLWHFIARHSSLDAEPKVAIDDRIIVLSFVNIFLIIFLVHLK
jgi:hypothetical protein